MLQLKVALEGEKEVRGRLRIIQREFEQRERAAMHRSVVLVLDEARAKIHSPEGRARRGIGYVITGAGDKLRGIIRPRSAAAIFAQRSRGPGKAMPPVNRIRAWLQRTGQERTPASAFLVARAIASRGTVGRPVMEESLEAKQNAVIAVFREMVERALRRRR